MTTVTSETTGPTRLMLFAALVRQHDMLTGWSESAAVRHRGEEDYQRLVTTAASLPPKYRGEILAIVELRARQQFPLEPEATAYVDAFGRAVDAAVVRRG